MKILCPNCNRVIKFSDLESHGVQMGDCSKCKIQIYATYEQREGGRKVWDAHFEEPPAPKKAEPKRMDGGTALMLWFFVFLAALIFCGIWVDMNGP
jgi:hypothetical protein